MSDNRDWQADMKDIQTWMENKHWVSMPHPEQTLNGEPLANIILHWLQQYAAEKERADKESELLLKTWRRAVDAEAREQKLRFALEWAIKEPSNWDDPEDTLDEVMAVFRNTLASLYPKEVKA